MNPHGEASPPPIRALADVDWNFPERVAHSGIEGIHPYRRYGYHVSNAVRVETLVVLSNP